MRSSKGISFRIRARAFFAKMFGSSSELTTFCHFLDLEPSKFQGKSWFDPAFTCRAVFGPCAIRFAKTADFRPQFIRALLGIRVHICMFCWLHVVESLSSYFIPMFFYLLYSSSRIQHQSTWHLFHINYHINYHLDILEFPKIGVPPNHPRLDNFSIQTYGDLVMPFLGNPHIAMCCFIARLSSSRGHSRLASLFSWRTRTGLKIH